MSEPTTRVTVNFVELLAEHWARHPELVKDLREGEIICRECHGLGVLIFDLPHRMMESQKNEHVNACVACYNGVQRLCPHCKNPIAKGSTVEGCSCDAAKELLAAAEERREEERLARCKHVRLADYKGDYLYDDHSDKYVLWDGDPDDLDPEHTYYACNPSAMAIDPSADTIIERIYEDAAQECDEGDEQIAIKVGAKEKLQEFLDAWVEENVDTGEVYWYDKHTIVDVAEADVADESIAASFHAHLDECVQCRENPDELCIVGAEILKNTAAKP